MNLYKSNRLRFLTILALMLGFSASASAAFFFITPPNTLLPNLKTYSQSAADWWLWLDGQQFVQETDTTGASCKLGQPVLGTWYLAQNDFGAPPVTRSCSIPFGRTLLIPIANVLLCASPDDSPEVKDIDSLHFRAKERLDYTNISLTIDGTSVPNITTYYEESTAFKLSPSADGVLNDPCADAGYYVAVSSLLPGNHTIHWRAESTTRGNVDVTYNIKTGLLPF